MTSRPTPAALLVTQRKSREPPTQGLLVTGLWSCLRPKGTNHPHRDFQVHQTNRQTNRLIDRQTRPTSDPTYVTPPTEGFQVLLADNRLMNTHIRRQTDGRTGGRACDGRSHSRCAIHHAPASHPAAVVQDLGLLLSSTHCRQPPGLTCDAPPASSSRAPRPRGAP